MAKQAYLECGRIVNTHGTRGEMRVESYCDSVEVLCALPTVYVRGADGGYQACPVLFAAPYKAGARMQLACVADMDTAEQWKGKTLYARREDIPRAPGAVFIADMLGLPVLDAESGRLYGTLHDVQPAPSADLYDILTPGGQHVLLPAVPAFLDHIDVEVGVYIRPIPGFFAPEEDGHAL